MWQTTETSFSVSASGAQVCECRSSPIETAQARTAKKKLAAAPREMLTHVLFWR
jgi:hypothetical protein